MLGHVLRPCEIVDHWLVDADGAVRAGDYIAASGYGCCQRIYRNAVLFEGLKDLVLSEIELLDHIAERSELLGGMAQSIVEYFLVVVIYRDLA